MKFENCLRIEPKDFKPWASNIVKSLEDIPHFKFWQESGEKKSSYISFEKIVGTSHELYSGGTWANALVNLKHHSYERPDQLLERICVAEPIPTLGKFGDEYYIFDGNNRLCKARFLNLDRFYCKVKEYTFNSYDFNISSILLQAGFNCVYNSGSEKRFGNITYSNSLILLSEEVTIEDFVNIITTIRYTIVDFIVFNVCSQNKKKHSFTLKKGNKSTRQLKKYLFKLGFRGIVQ